LSPPIFWMGGNDMEDELDLTIVIQNIEASKRDRGGRKEKTYVCTQCGAHDKVKLFESEAAPMVINCWKCKAGRGIEVQQMVMTKVGMFPAVEA
jgi:hypothetical protein